MVRLLLLVLVLMKLEQQQVLVLFMSLMKPEILMYILDPLVILVLEPQIQQKNFTLLEML